MLFLAWNGHQKPTTSSTLGRVLSAGPSCSVATRRHLTCSGLSKRSWKRGSGRSFCHRFPTTSVLLRIIDLTPDCMNAQMTAERSPPHTPALTQVHRWKTWPTVRLNTWPCNLGCGLLARTICAVGAALVLEVKRKPSGPTPSTRQDTELSSLNPVGVAGCLNEVSRAVVGPVPEHTVLNPGLTAATY